MDISIEKIKYEFDLWKKEFGEHKWLLLLSLFLLCLAALLQYLAGNYTNRIETVPVPDLILDHIPVINLSYLFNYGYMFIIAILFLYPLFFRVRDLHVVISQFTLLVALREFFVCLTHLQAPAGAIFVKFPGIISTISFQNDLFFSGHTAVPFLGYLLFRKEKPVLAIFFLISTIIMAITVLLMHAHYSIDVFSAFFITYGSFKIGE